MFMLYVLHTFVILLAYSTFFPSYLSNHTEIFPLGSHLLICHNRQVRSMIDFGPNPVQINSMCGILLAMMLGQKGPKNMIICLIVVETHLVYSLDMKKGAWRLNRWWQPSCNHEENQSETRKKANPGEPHKND